MMDSKIEGLHTTGSTALGPALAISAGIIADSPMSEVILCTDGEPNVGIGSLSGSRRQGGAEFYRRVNFDIVMCNLYILSIIYPMTDVLYYFVFSNDLFSNDFFKIANVHTPLNIYLHMSRDIRNGFLHMRKQRRRSASR